MVGELEEVQEFHSLARAVLYEMQSLGMQYLKELLKIHGNCQHRSMRILLALGEFQACSNPQIRLGALSFDISTNTTKLADNRNQHH